MPCWPALAFRARRPDQNTGRRAHSPRPPSGSLEISMMLSGDAPPGNAFFNGCASDEEHRADEHKRCADHQDIERVGHSHTCLLRVYTKIICMFCVAWEGGRGATSPPMTPPRPDALRQGNEKTSLLGVQVFCRKSQKESRQGQQRYSIKLLFYS